MVKFKVIFLIVVSFVVVGALALLVLFGLNKSQAVDDSSAATLDAEMKAEGCVAFRDDFNRGNAFDYKFVQPVGQVKLMDYLLDGSLRIPSPGFVYGPRVGKNFGISTEFNGLFDSELNEARFGVDARIALNEKTPEWNAYFIVHNAEEVPSFRFIVNENSKEVYRSKIITLKDLKQEVRLAIVKDKRNLTAYYTVDRNEVEVGTYKLKTDKSTGLYSMLSSSYSIHEELEDRVQNDPNIPDTRAGIVGGASFDNLRITCAKL